MMQMVTEFVTNLKSAVALMQQLVTTTRMQRNPRTVHTQTVFASRAQVKQTAQEQSLTMTPTTMAYVMLMRLMDVKTIQRVTSCQLQPMMMVAASTALAKET